MSICRLFASASDALKKLMLSVWSNRRLPGRCFNWTGCETAPSTDVFAGLNYGNQANLLEKHAASNLLLLNSMQSRLSILSSAVCSFWQAGKAPCAFTCIPDGYLQLKRTVLHTTGKPGKLSRIGIVTTELMIGFPFRIL